MLNIIRSRLLGFRIARHVKQDVKLTKQNRCFTIAGNGLSEVNEPSKLNDIEPLSSKIKAAERDLKATTDSLSGAIIEGDVNRRNVLESLVLEQTKRLNSLMETAACETWQQEGISTPKYLLY